MRWFRYDDKGEMQKMSETWDKKNMKFVRGKYKKEFVDEFKAACDKLGITQSEVFRFAMQQTIDKAKEKNHSLPEE